MADTFPFAERVVLALKHLDMLAEAHGGTASLADLICVANRWSISTDDNDRARMRETLYECLEEIPK